MLMPLKLYHGLCQKYATRERTKVTNLRRPVTSLIFWHRNSGIFFKKSGFSLAIFVRRSIVFLNRSIAVVLKAWSSTIAFTFIRVNRTAYTLVQFWNNPPNGRFPSSHIVQSAHSIARWKAKWLNYMNILFQVCSKHPRYATPTQSLENVYGVKIPFSRLCAGVA